MSAQGSIDHTHECPAPGCEARVPYERLACRRHWFAIPKPLRDQLWLAWRHGSVAEHARVRAECVRVLEGEA